MLRVTRLLACLAATAVASAQGVGDLNLGALKQQVLGQDSSLSSAGLLPSTPNRVAAPQGFPGMPEADAEAKARTARIQAMKAKEGGPVRFASDLFEVRQPGFFSTDGGVSEDYVLGVGDQIYLNATGSANFDFTASVDGAGSVAIPKVGNARVGGMTLGKAKAALQRLVGEKFSRTRVDLQVVQLREIRVSILGEVYLPGSYLVPSLASLVNVLSLAGGPTGIGSFRDIRVVRGGRIVSHLDLYPLRAEGTGNPDFALQSGDVVFVPLAEEQILMEGAFRRVARAASNLTGAPALQVQDAADLERDAIRRKIQAVQSQLGAVPAPPRAAAQPDLGELVKSPALADPKLRAAIEASVAASPAPASAPALDEKARASLENQLIILNADLAALDAQSLADHRVHLDPITGMPTEPRDLDMPDWIKVWREKGIAPRMSFELKPGETLADAVRFAGGIMPDVASSTLTIRRRDAAGGVSAFTADAGQAATAFPLQTGDAVFAMLQRGTLDRIVSVQGWARVPGDFSRADGLRVGDLLKRDGQVLPDTYLARGEVVHLHPDGTTAYEAFDVGKALAGDPGANLLLQDRDRVELYRIGDRRLPQLLTVSGPVAFPGAFQFHEGMRASDLIFRAGVLQKGADELDAQISRTKDGKTSSVIPLDLPKLASSDTASPVGLRDDAVNPLLQPDDQLSFFKKPGYRVHRLVSVDGQVVRPGVYALEDEHETLSHLIARAGGLTPEAMPAAGIFLRQVGTGASLRALAKGDRDPLPDNISAILGRLNETKRNPLSGALQDNPLLHTLSSGDLNRLVVDFRAALKGDHAADAELRDGDRIIIPRLSEEAYVVGETASPFAAYKVEKGATVREVLRFAGGLTRNADAWNIRLLKADGRIVDSWVMGKKVEPGDAVLVPQRIRRDTTWQENLQALTPIAILLNTLK